MLNYKTGHNNARLFIEAESKKKKSKAKKKKVDAKAPKNEYEMKAISAIPHGAEIFNTYGDLANSELLLKYGYVEDEPNPFDFVKLYLPAVLEAIRKSLPRKSNFQKRLQLLE